MCEWTVINTVACFPEALFLLDCSWRPFTQFRYAFYALNYCNQISLAIELGSTRPKANRISNWWAQNYLQRNHSVLFWRSNQELCDPNRRIDLQRIGYWVLYVTSFMTGRLSRTSNIAKTAASISNTAEQLFGKIPVIYPTWENQAKKIHHMKLFI